jgi:purine nucleosidase/pyrimidine-specific ribonucleoside hydrolase
LIFNFGVISLKKIILDTDIGDDIDDALALGLILASKELDCVGITTVFRNAYVRTMQVRTILKWLKREEIPVAAGCGAIISPETLLPFNPADKYLSGLLTNQHRISLPEEDLFPLYDGHGVDFIIEKILDGDGDITLMCIGPMTNIAMALIKEPKIIHKIPKIILMGGAFEIEKAEYNILCDPVAAEYVFKSGIPIDIVGLDVTLRMKLNQMYLNNLGESNSTLAKILYKTIQVWIKYCDSPGEFPTLHDPLAVLVMLYPDIVKWRTGTAKVMLRDKAKFSFTCFDQNKNGNHRYAYDVDENKAIDLWFERITQFDNAYQKLH